MSSSTDTWLALAGRANADAEQEQPTTAKPPRRRSAPAKPARRFAVGPGTDARDGATGNYPLSELGNAARLVDLHGDDLRYVAEPRIWLVWEEDHWVWDHDGSKVRTLAADLPQVIYREGAADLSQFEHYVKWARKSQSGRVIRETIALAADVASLRTSIDAVDGDELLVGFDGARRVVDLRTGITRSAERTDLVTRAIDVAALGQPSQAHRWHQFLEDVFQGDHEVIHWLQRFLGYVLSGSTREQIMLFAHGAGANGKSVLFGVLGQVLGDYCRTAQPETFMMQSRQGGAPSPDLARLAGARCVIASETDEGRLLGESLIKQLTGGERLTVRGLYQQPFEYTPQFKILMSGNHQPGIRGGDEGIWRRMRVLPFGRHFPPESRDPGLIVKLISEASHIAAWIVEGACSWIKFGLGPTPTCMLAATAEYREAEDYFGEWLKERTARDGQSLGTTLYADFTRWSEGRGEQAGTYKAFCKRLKQKHLEAPRGNAGRRYELRLRVSQVTE